MDGKEHQKHMRGMDGNSFTVVRLYANHRAAETGMMEDFEIHGGTYYKTNMMLKSGNAKILYRVMDEKNIQGYRVDFFITDRYLDLTPQQKAFLRGRLILSEIDKECSANVVLQVAAQIDDLDLTQS